MSNNFIRLKIKSTLKIKYRIFKRGDQMQIEQTTIRLPRELKKKLLKQAKTKGYTLKDMVIFILKDYLQNTSQE